MANLSESLSKLPMLRAVRFADYVRARNFVTARMEKLKKRDENPSSAKIIRTPRVLFVALRQLAEMHFDVHLPARGAKAFRRLHKNRSLPFPF